MLFIPENDLERALVRAVKEPAAAPDFYRLLLESNLLVLGTAEGREGATEEFSLAPGSQLSLVTGLKDGHQYLPVFSSVARMQEFVKQESKYLSIRGQDLLDLTRGAPVILNPASEYGKELTAEQVGQLLGPPRPLGAPRTIVSDTNYPAPLVEALIRVFKAHPDVDAAWMIQVTLDDQTENLRPLVGIETDNSAGFRALVEAIQQEANISGLNMMFDVQHIDRRNPTSLTNALLQAPPFYIRGGSQKLN
jgi:hypothetical protein